MPRITSSWWDDDFTSQLEDLKFSHIISSALSGLLVLSFDFLLPSQVFTAIFKAVTLFLLIICSTILINRNNNSRTIFLVISTTEFCSFLMWYFSRTTLDEHRAIFIIGATFNLLLLQIPCVKSRFFCCILIAKHIYQWYIFDILKTTESYTSNLSPYIVVSSCLIIQFMNISTTFKSGLLTFSLHRKAEETERCLNFLCQSFCDGFLVLSDDLKIEYLNSNILALFECEENQLLNNISCQTYWDGKKLNHLTNSSFIIDDIKAAFALPINGEALIGISKLRSNLLEWKIKKMHWKSKPSLVIFSRNVNHLIELESLSSECRAKTDLLNFVSHELRAPANSIILFQEQIIEEEGSRLKTTTVDKLQTINVLSHLLLSFVNDLLDHSRIMAGAFNLNKSNFDIRDVIKDSCKLFEIQAKLKHIDLRIRLDPTLPHSIYSDPMRIGQILVNLIGNSLKFTTTGSIEVCVFTSHFNRIEFSVTDTGAGILQSRLASLFTAFSTSNSGNYNPQGVGLGLYISGILAKALNGTSIQVESHEGKGSKFTFYLDLNEKLEFALTESDMGLVDEGLTSPIVMKARRESCHRNFSKDKVLIVDDNDFNRIILGAILDKNQIGYIEADSGTKALHIVQKQNNKGRYIKLIIMDCHMPVIDGWEATKKIHEMHKTQLIRHMPAVIGYTASSSEEEIKKCFEYGMVTYLLKPARPELLMELINQYLGFDEESSNAIAK
ncbi:unnamed protein product [Blepharisma stoltei]|uniref:histidine kinase n=1 Tax=Blepharisma stoltei TaxID=1481888 RepID=A0AAU9K4X9_9CILI|nr:unnamed protein product [Blepharisma stoltei]